MPSKSGRPTSATLVSTPNVTRIRELLDQALDSVDPLEFRYTVEKFGSLQAAKERATSLQNQVSSVRARARNIKQAQIGQKNSLETGEQIRGRYDDLACSKRLLRNGEGYVVLIGRTPEDEFEIYNHRTGERILYVDPRTKRADELMDYFTSHIAFQAKGHSPLTAEQEVEFHALNPQWFKDAYEATSTNFPTWYEKLQQLQAEPTPDFDLVDVPMDAFGVGPGDDESDENA